MCTKCVHVYVCGWVESMHETWSSEVRSSVSLEFSEIVVNVSSDIECL